MRILEGHTTTETVLSVAFAPGGERLASASADGAVRLWRVVDGAAEVVGETKGAGAVAFSQDGSTLAWSSWVGVWCHDFPSRTTARLDAELGWPVVGLATLAFLPSGQLTVACELGLRVIDREKGPIGPAWAGSRSANCHALSPDGRWLALAFTPPRKAGVSLRVYDVWKQRSTSPRNFAGPYCSSLAFAPDGTRIALTSGTRLLVWRRTGHQPEAECQIDQDHYFTGLAFGPDGRHLAVCRNDRTLYVYETANWTVVASFDWKVGNPTCVAFSPDGHLAAVGGTSGKVVLWDVDL